MNFSKVYSAQANLLDANIIDIEIDISRGLHFFSIVGLPDKVVGESKDRVSAALKNSGYKSPKQTNHKITISLAPANLKKAGPIFDLPIALGYLKAVKEIDFRSDKKIFVGELSLDGKLRKINGILPIIISAKQKGFEEIYLPAENLEEALLIPNIKIYSIKCLQEIIHHFKFPKSKIPCAENKSNGFQQSQKYTNSSGAKIFNEIQGQESAKRALIISACGGHNLGFYGPPGTGKTMLAKAFGEILPPLSYEKLLETNSIHSNLENKKLITFPPVRSPHHTSSYSAIVGGGHNLKIGEITLAHNGILFLDEFLEFDQRTINALREPLEQKKITISRTNERKTFPANFILIIATNPCPCGYYKTPQNNCKCTINEIRNYRRKLSGPIIDRVDMWVEVNNIDNQILLKSLPQKSDYNPQQTIIQTRLIQKHRFAREKLNKDMTPDQVKYFCQLEKGADEILNQASNKLNLSARSYHNVLKVSRTIADLDRSEKIKSSHILESLQYRYRQ